ncbi:MAG: PDZ domain-containing protein, partial [Panacibacter sp.]
MRNIFIILLCVSLNTLAQTPPRKAIMGLQGKAVSNGIQVDSIIPNTTFALLKLQKGDILTSINGTKINTLTAYNAVASGIRTSDKTEISFLHNNKEITAKTNAVMRPYEQSEIADVQYDWVKFREGYLRVITRKPKSKTNCPAILLIPGYGCGSIENYATSYNGKLINEWLKAGYAVVTIEKSGLGDSYNCAACTEVDLVTDIESFDAGYNYMQQLPFVDTSNLYVWGHSMGGVIAPEVAKRHHPKAVMVFGTTFRPWSEFLLE